MTYCVVTTFHAPGMKQYGQRMINTFDQYWPQDVPLWVYAEECEPQLPGTRVHVLDLMQACPDLATFKTRHANDPVAHGHVSKNTALPFRDNQFKWDAVRFSHKVFAVMHACATQQSDWVIWLDADTQTFDHVPASFLAGICDPHAMACYLGRNERYHSECGWVAYNLRHPDIKAFMERWHSIYMTGELFGLAEYHDSFVFDTLRREFQEQRKTVFCNISPQCGSTLGPGHPFIASPLGQYMDHMKGDRRKRLGHSLPDDYGRNLGVVNSHPYWQKIFKR